MSDQRRRSDGGGQEGPPSSPSPKGQFLHHYKRDQGKWTRMGTFVGLLALVVWGAAFLHDKMQVFQGDALWQLVVTTGIPIAFGVLLGGLSWWVAYSNHKSSDFMIATEGEMKKVSWSTRREVIGSTKVVIVFTIVMAALLFVVDIFFQGVFSWINVLKAG